MANKRKSRSVPPPEPEATVEELPLLPRREALVFPKLVAQLAVFRPAFQRSLQEAVAGDRRIVIIGRRNVQSSEFDVNDLYEVGTMSMVGRMLKLPEGAATVWLQGEERVRILEVTQTEPFYKAKVQVLTEPEEDSVEQQASMRSVLALFEKCVQLSPMLSWDALRCRIECRHTGMARRSHCFIPQFGDGATAGGPGDSGPREAAQRRQPPPCPRS